MGYSCGNPGPPLGEELAGLAGWPVGRASRGETSQFCDKRQA